MSKNKRHKILIIKIGALGDMITASTMIGALRAKHPDAHITWLCGRDLAPFVELLDGVDEILTANRHLLSGNVIHKFMFVLYVWRLLFLKEFDLCLIGQHGANYKLLPLFARCGEVRAFGGRNGPLTGRYRGDEYARLAEGSDNYATRHAPLAKISLPVVKNNMVMMLPAGAYNEPPFDGLRRWPAERYAELARRLLDMGFNVGLIGEPRDKWAEKHFEGLPVTSYIGETTIPGLLSLLAGSRALIAHDSGPMHMAVIMGVPIVGIFGPTLHKDCIVESDKAIALSASKACSPCYDGKNYAQCKSNICLKDISVEQVLATLDKLGIKPH